MSAKPDKVMWVTRPHPEPSPEWDVVVVGAGLAGLTAARRLDEAGKRVLVLESAGHVGGRMIAQSLVTHPDLCVDLGGQWVGPSQDRMLALATELGVRRFEAHPAGSTVLIWKGQRSTFDGSFPPFTGQPPAVSAKELTDGKRIWGQIESLGVGPEPWTHPRAVALDAEVLSDWLDVSSTTDFGRFVVTVMARIGGSGAFEPRDVSRLHMLFTQSVSPQCEEPEALAFFGSAGQFPLLIARQFSHRVEVLCNSRVHRIEQDPRRGVTAFTVGAKFNALKAVVAVPPVHAGRITYGGIPNLPPERLELTRNAPMGKLIKNHAIYDDAFWRHAAPALNGEAVGDLYTIQWTADSSPPTGRPGTLTSFIAGDRATSLSHVDTGTRRALVLADYARYFGEKALAPKEYVEKNWIVESGVEGAFTSFMNPGAWTTTGAALRTPVGHIHWAGTETAFRWNGYFDGAVRSGEDAALAVLGAT